MSADRRASYGFSVTVPLPFEQAVEATRAALATQGFGVLTEIDVRATLRKKLDVEFRPYVILGACNPRLAHQALSAEPEAGLLLPCNVVVQATDEAGESRVSVLDPLAMMGLTGRDDIVPIALDARGRLEQALAALPTG